MTKTRDYEKSKTGTAWVRPGEGASIADLTRICMRMQGKPVLQGRALSHLRQLYQRAKEKGMQHLTNLALTGAWVSWYDIERITYCE